MRGADGGGASARKAEEGVCRGGVRGIWGFEGGGRCPLCPPPPPPPAVQCPGRCPSRVDVRSWASPPGGGGGAGAPLCGAWLCGDPLNARGQCWWPRRSVRDVLCLCVGGGARPDVPQRPPALCVGDALGSATGGRRGRRGRAHTSVQSVCTGTRGGGGAWGPGRRSPRHSDCGPPSGARP